MKTVTKPKSILAAIITVVILIASAVLYQNGIISESTYLDIIGAVNPGVSYTEGAEVHYIDVGQAECILIKTSDKNILIDAGNLGYGNEIKSYLHANGVNSLDIFILTHPHADHIGSAPDILKSFSVEKLILPKIPSEYLPTTSIFEKTLLAASENGCTVSYAKPGTVFEFADTKLEIFGPCDTYGDEYNNYSIVSKFTCGAVSYLFTGDAEEEAELDVINSGADLSCTVFSAGHHGSSTSNSKALMKAASPEYAVISCGIDNDYGHPHKETVAIFKEFGIEYYRTDYDGSVVVSTDGANVFISTSK